MINTINMDILLDITRKAGAAILEVYGQDFSVDIKEDRSPLTNADRASNEVIVAELQKAYPDIPFISEETKQSDYTERKDWEYCWLIDPLDGTKEFIKRNGEFTVNIALLHRGETVLGVIGVPVKNEFYYAVKGQGSFKIENDTAPFPIKIASVEAGQPVKVVASRSHLNDDTKAFIENLATKHAQVETVAAGSSLKFCLVAEGKAHYYPRYAPTMEWDTAAGHIIAQEAGASVTIPDTGEAMRYNKENLLNPYFLVAI